MASTRLKKIRSRDQQHVREARRIAKDCDVFVVLGINRTTKKPTMFTWGFKELKSAARFLVSAGVDLFQSEKQRKEESPSDRE